MPYYVLEFKAPYPLTFRTPSGLEVASHGPGVSGRSLDLPFPSTLAGSLGYLAYISNKDACNVADINEYKDIEKCLEVLFGTNNYSLYAGFMRSENGEILYYNPVYGFLKPEELEKVLRCFMNIKSGDCDNEVKGIRLKRHLRTGIALKRGSKTIQSEHLFGLEYVEPYSNENGFSYVVLLKIEKSLPAFSSVIKLGGENRVAFVSSSPLEKDLINILIHKKDNCSKWIIHLLSPALLDASPWHDVVILDRSKGRELAKLLLSNVNANAEVISVPKGYPIGLEVIAPGWTSVLKRPMPRKPLLLIPPGTLIEMKNTNEKLIEKIVLDKLGTVGRKIGWGTAFATCI